MIEIDEDMVAIISRAILSFCATVNEDNTPNLSPKASLLVREGDLVFADIASPKTIANILRNPAIAINVVDIFSRRGYRFEGLAEILSEGTPEHTELAAWIHATQGPQYPVNNAVRIKVTSASPLLSPAYVFGDEDEASLRSTYMKKYGVQQAD